MYKLRNKGKNLLVVPRTLVDNLLTADHHNNGHQGIARTVVRFNLRYVWQGRYKDVSYVIGQESGRAPSIEIGSLLITKPLELVVLDFVTLYK